uniref:PNPLA domain-containing protein n=1 Tax=viral metagenome TaxID=1070528 RepID=A0A6C0BS80_9ZZZZ
MLKTKLLDELINNIDIAPPTQPELIDIVLDSGAVNGGYLIGCLLYLKELEKKGYIKIRKISGSSIGAVCGFTYICDTLELYDDIYSNSRNDIICNLNLKKCSKMLKTFIYNQSNDFYTKFNNRLYIAYYDINQKCDICTYNYSSNKDLYLKLRYSTFLPLLINGNLSMNNKCDSCIPKPFYEDNKVLFINLTTYKKLFTAINVSSKNSMYKILHGIIDIHQFYTTGDKTELCSYINNWSFYDHILFRLRFIITFILKYTLALFIDLQKHYNDNNDKYKSIIINYMANLFRNYVLLVQI